MIQNLIRCERCDGNGYVKIYLDDFNLTSFMCESITLGNYMFISMISGGPFGIIYFILLRTKLPFFYFGIIFYFFGVFSLTILLYDESNRCLFFILIIIFSSLNTLLGYYIYSSNNIFIIILNIIHSFILGTSIIFNLILLYHKIKENYLNSIKCPLCNGNKFIYENIFNEMERCEYCYKDMGYKNPNYLTGRYFCEKCNGKGFKLKSNEIIIENDPSFYKLMV